MLKIAVLIVTLACASAGYTGAGYSYVAPEAAHYSSVPAVSYSTFNRLHSPSLAYGSPSHGYAHATPVVAAPSYAYATPLAHTYAAPALSYGQSYAPSLSHQNYEYSTYAAPLATNTLAVAQPQHYNHNTYATHAVAAPVLATRGFNYAPAAAGAHLLGYNNHHGHYAY